jgi:Arc/MetJ-type ribon-helix-helix transcriptional regulator
MASVRLDVATEAALNRLSSRRGQTRSEVIRDAIVRLAEEAEEESQPRSAYQRLEPFVGIADSGGRQLSTETGKRLREILKERQLARHPG